MGLALAGLRDAARMVVTEDGSGIAAAVVRCLAERGVAAEVVAQVPADADAVIFLGGLRALASVEEALAVNREAFQAARTLAPRAAAGNGLFVTVQDTGGDFGLSGRDAMRAWLGGIAALGAQRAPRMAARSAQGDRLRTRQPIPRRHRARASSPSCSREATASMWAWARMDRAGYRASRPAR